MSSSAASSGMRLAASDVPTQGELEALLVNNSSLEKIEAYLTRFNPIKIMKMEAMEIRHSNILGWLLDPQETHSLGDQFLKSFISEALRANEQGGGVSALEVARADLKDAVVRREWKNIDIFILSERNGWAFIIENKFGSKQSANQLRGYWQKVERANLSIDPRPKISGILLTLDDEEPADERFVTVRYDTVSVLLERVLSYGDRPLNEGVRQFLGHYLEVIKEATGTEEKLSEMQAIARQLYLEHRKTLEFIIKHGATSDFAAAVENVFGSPIEFHKQTDIAGQSFAISNLKSNLLACVPASWEKILAPSTKVKSGCETWWAGLPLVIWVRLDRASDGNAGKLRIVAEVGPMADGDLRAMVVNNIAQLGKEPHNLRIQFTKTALKRGTLYSRFLKANVVDISDTGDAEEISGAMSKLFRKFRPEFDAVSELLPEFVELAEA